MKILKQSTAVTLHYGQFVDKTDGVTPETAIASMAVYLGKNGGTMALRNSATAITHDRGGYYFLALDATDTNTLGRLKIQTTDSAVHLGVWDDWMVVPANVYDSLVPGTDRLQVDVAEMAANVVTASALATDAVTEIQSGLSTVTTAQVNAEVVDALNVDTYAEPGQEAPPATTTLVKKIGWLYKLARNRKTQTATTLSVYADNGTTVDAKATVSDDGVTYDHSELATGP